jgi:hypothetical protein
MTRALAEEAIRRDEPVATLTRPSRTITVEPVEAPPVETPVEEPPVEDPLEEPPVEDPLEEPEPVEVPGEDPEREPEKV